MDMNTLYAPSGPNARGNTMKVESASKLIGKIVTFEDGTQVLLCSNGQPGTGESFVFQRATKDDQWTQMSMRESLPIVLALAKQVLGMELGGLV